MIFDVIRFNQLALDLLAEAEESEVDPSGGSTDVRIPKTREHESVGTFLERGGYSKGFCEDYLIPMTACVWSTSPDKCSLDFPAITLIRFLWNHHLLNTISARPKWLTIPGGTMQYVHAALKGFTPEHIHLSAGIKSLTVKENKQIELRTQDDRPELFDHVILATHGDQAMDIIRETATPQEAEIMSNFKTNANTAVLHSDLSVCFMYARDDNTHSPPHSSCPTEKSPGPPGTT